MTPEQIKLFVYRLRLNDVSRSELEALSIEDLTAINLHLFKSRRNRRGKRDHAGPVLYGSMVISEGSKRTYSEQEILAELGVVS